ncbi:MAG: hypothetical protein NC420_04035 [Eubacterium sp.]|nr:hypothetical protein [Eubacterium sp.]
MRDVTTEQRLRLVQQVRSRYHENQYDLSNRERILYGKSFVREPSDNMTREAPDTDPRPFSTFKIRLVIALLLGAAVISMDRNDIKIAGITSEQIYQVISADLEENIEKVVTAMSQDTVMDPVTED